MAQTLPVEQLKSSAFLNMKSFDWIFQAWSISKHPVTRCVLCFPIGVLHAVRRVNIDIFCAEKSCSCSKKRSIKACPKFPPSTCDQPRMQHFSLTVSGTYSWEVSHGLSGTGVPIAWGKRWGKHIWISRGVSIITRGGQNQSGSRHQDAWWFLVNVNEPHDGILLHFSQIVQETCAETLMRLWCSTQADSSLVEAYAMVNDHINHLIAVNIYHSTSC